MVQIVPLCGTIYPIVWDIFAERPGDLLKAYARTMRLRSGARWVAVAAITGAIGAPPAASAAPPTTLRVDGVGPLTLGMTRASAVRTGWLSHRSSGCEVASPVPVTYRLDGAKAPKALNGSAEFLRGRLRTLTFGGGVRTPVGVRVGSTSADLLSRYRAAGFTATSRYDEQFEATFLTVKRRQRQMLGALAANGRVTQIALPAVRVCE